MTDLPAASDDEAAARRSRLVGLKLRALVGGHLGVDDLGDPETFAPGAALMVGDDAWLYLDHRPSGRLGAALAWAIRAGATSVNLIAESGTGVLARRAAAFSLPVDVWHADERSLLAAVAEPLTDPLPAPAAHEEFRGRIIEGGAEPVVEHGVLTGEVRGLEVCRVVDDPHTGSTRLEVGVGAHDREAFQMLHGDVPTIESLARVVEAVSMHRQPGAPQHPLNRLAAERLLRWQLLRSPDLAGAVGLVAAPPPVPRENLKDAVPCVAWGEDADGGRVVVVSVSGVDLDVIPYAADARLAAAAALPGIGGGIRVVVASPGRDRIRVIDELAGLLSEPVEFVAVG